MIWLVWRQHRLEGLIALGVLALVGIFLLRTGLEMASSFQQFGLGPCQGQAATGSACGALEQAFENQYGLLLLSTGPSLVVLPLLLGTMVCAPLVAREVEHRTHLLVWTQSITRTRWLTMKLALVLGAGLVASGALLALLIWWRSPSAQFTSPLSNNAYDISGPVWLAAALLAMALGVFAGALTRQVRLAIFLTGVLFVTIRAPVELFLRPNFEPTMTVTWPIGQPAPTLSNQDWQISSGYLDAHGNAVKVTGCTRNETIEQCLQANGVQANYLTYQPADHFWALQWIETSIYVGFSVLALGAAFWLVRRLN